MVKQIAHIYIQIRMYKASEQKNIYPLGRDSRHFKLTFRRKTKYFNDNWTHEFLDPYHAIQEIQPSLIRPTKVNYFHMYCEILRFTVPASGGRLQQLRSLSLRACLAVSEEESMTVGTFPSFKSITGPYFFERFLKDWCCNSPSWCKFPMIGHVGGEGIGRCCSRFGRLKVARRRKMTRKRIGRRKMLAICELLRSELWRRKLMPSIF